MKLHYGDMTDSSCLVKIIVQVRPNEIYNLAAQSHVKVMLPLSISPRFTCFGNGDLIIENSIYENCRCHSI